MKSTPTAQGRTGADKPPAYLHTYDEAARMLGGISRRQIYRLIEAGDLEAITLGPRNHMVSDESMRALIRKRKGKGAANDDDDVGGSDGA